MHHISNIHISGRLYMYHHIEKAVAQNHTKPSISKYSHMGVKTTRKVYIDQ
jgi:hypothetical protein